MLPHTRRISRKDFPYILTKGKRYSSQHLLLYINPISTLGGAVPSRFSFSLSKKVSPKAVVRNTYRRRGYAVISLYIDQVKPNYFCFFSFKKGSIPMNFQDLKKEIYGLLSEALMIL